MIYLTSEQVLELHRQIIATSQGLPGVRDSNGLFSAVDQPRMTFAGRDLYPSLAEKASALGFSLIKNHPFVDGNKRVGHAAMEVFVSINGFEFAADIDEQERLILGVAAGSVYREELTDWIRSHLVPRVLP